MSLVFFVFFTRFLSLSFFFLSLPHKNRHSFDFLSLCSIHSSSPHSFIPHLLTHSLFSFPFLLFRSSFLCVILLTVPSILPFHCLLSFSFCSFSVPLRIKYAHHDFSAAPLSSTLKPLGRGDSQHHIII
jgi:hypothetical protein